MKIISTTNRVLACEDLGQPLWFPYHVELSPSPVLFALPMAIKGSESRYRVFPADTKFTLVSKGDECHYTEWEVSKAPLGEGYFLQDLHNASVLNQLGG